MTTLTKGKTVDTSNFQPGELIQMDFAFCNVTSIRIFTSMITVVHANIIILWVFPTAYKRDPVRIIRFILTTLNNEEHLWKIVRVDKYYASEKSTDVTNLPDEEFKISTKTTGGDAYWINRKNKKHNISIHNMVRSGLLDSNQHAKNGSLKKRHKNNPMDEKSTVD